MSLLIDYRHCAYSSCLTPQSLAHFCGATDKLLPKSKNVVVPHSTSLDILASVAKVEVAIATIVLQLEQKIYRRRVG